MFVRRVMHARPGSRSATTRTRRTGLRAGCLAAVLAACAATSAAQVRELDASRAVQQHPGDAPALVGAVDAIAHRWIDEKGVAGMSIAVVRDGELLILKGYGKAHVELDVDTPERAVYEIASESKTFTAVAILRLVEQGKLSLDDSLIEHLPGVFPDAVARRVSIRQLLTHSSGIYEYMALPEYEALVTQALPRERVVPLIAAQPFSFEPGAAQAYSNSGFLVLGLVIEKITGKSWGKHIEEDIFPAAGMRDSRASWNRQVVPRLATGYEFSDEGGLRRAEHHEPEWFHGNGGLRSTAGDMAAWMERLHNGKILGAAAYRELTTPGKLSDGTPLRYGLGLAVDQPVLGHRVFRHGGTFPGYTSYAAYLPDRKVTVVVLINTKRPELDEDSIPSEIIKIMVGDKSPTLPDVKEGSQEYVGKYRASVLRSKRELVIGIDSNGRLTAMVEAWGEAPRPLRYAGGETFTGGWVDYVFFREAGAVVGVRRISGDWNVAFERDPPH